MGKVENAGRRRGPFGVAHGVLHPGQRAFHELYAEHGPPCRGQVKPRVLVLAVGLRVAVLVGNCVLDHRLSIGHLDLLDHLNLGAENAHVSKLSARAKKAFSEWK